MPQLNRKPSLITRRVEKYHPVMQHATEDKDLNEEIKRLYRLIRELRNKRGGALQVLNTLGSPISPGTLLGYTSAGVMALADAGDGTAAGTKIRPIMVSPKKTVAVNERFAPHGTGELAYVRVDGVGTYTVGKRLVCSATAGVASVTVPASPDKLFSVGWISDVFNTDQTLALARIDLGTGTTT